jgi:hypothetical protein
MWKHGKTGDSPWKRLTAATHYRSFCEVLRLAAVVLIPNVAEAVPLALEKSLAEKADSLVEEAQVVVVNPRRRGRRRRWVCWWNRGRRVCGWRW